MQYLINEGHFTLPGNWQGSSMNILTPVLSAIAGANVVVTREILPDGALFDDYLVVQKRNSVPNCRKWCSPSKNAVMYRSARRNTGNLAGITRG